MGDVVTLLDGYVSIYAMRVRVALAEKGIEYESKLEKSLMTSKSEFLLEMNPVHKKIPVLIHNGKPVCESMIIVEYIDEVWKDKSPLLPSDPYQRAQARFWADFVDQRVTHPARKICLTKGEKQEEAKKEFIEALKSLERELGEKPYFGGHDFSLTDIALITSYVWFYTYETLGNFSIEEHCPKLMAWGKRCMLRESVLKLPQPHEIYEVVLAFDLPKIYEYVYGSKEQH